MPGQVLPGPVNLMHKTLLALMIAPLALAFLPTAHAAIQPPPVTQCWNYNWDSDHDGTYESWHTCGTPPCGCNCPVVGAILTIHTGDSERMVGVWASCQSGYGTAGEEGDGSYGATVTPQFYGAGLDPLVDRVTYTLESLVSCGC